MCLLAQSISLLMHLLAQSISFLMYVLAQCNIIPRALTSSKYSIHHVLTTSKYTIVSKCAKIRNRYNQIPHLTQDTNEKVTNSQLDNINESQEVSPFPVGDHKAQINVPYVLTSSRYKFSCVLTNLKYIIHHVLTSSKYTIPYVLTSSKYIVMPPKELWEAYSNRTVRQSIHPSVPLCVQCISPILFEVGIPDLVCGYILGWRSVAYHFRVTVTLTLTSDLVFIIIVSEAYLLYYLR